MKTLPSCPKIEQLRAFVLGGLSEPNVQAITQHLHVCDDCRALFQGLKESELTTRCFARTADGDRPKKQTSYPFLRPAEEPDEIGRLGEYRVLRLLGRGGMGMVFQAEDTTLRRPVALKVITTDPESNSTGQRFLREARLLASIKHKHVVSVFQTGQEGNVMYLAMELLSGESLEDWMNRVKRPSTAQILRLAREIASGLTVVHSHGLIHRDIKPANIWLESPAVVGDAALSRAGGGKRTTSSSAGRVKLLDFGLARHVQGDTQLTQTGSILGTPAFMSPEQARGDSVDERSDLFSLGCVLYCMAAGRSPFRSETPMAVLTSLAVDTPSPIQKHRSDLPEPLAGLIMQLLEKEPADRPESAEAVLEQCRQIKAWLADPDLPPPGGRGRSWHALPRRRSVWIGLAVGLAFLVGIAFLPSLFRSKPLPPPPPGPGKPAVEIRPAPAEGKVVYLNELEPIARQNWPFRPGGPPKGPPGPGGNELGPKGPPEPPPGLPPGDNHPVRYQGKGSPHGIFMHPPGPPIEGQPASLSVRLGKQYQTFSSVVTLNDGPPRSKAPMQFAVYCDGELRWKSQPVQSQADTQTVTIPVKGVEVLKIEVTCSDVGAAHAAWVDPYLIR